MKILIVISVIFIGLSAFSQQKIDVQLVQAVPHGGYRVGVGSRVELVQEGQSHSRQALFLGRLITPNRSYDSNIFYDLEANSILYVDKNQVNFRSPGQENVLKSYPQMGGTCTGYAINNFLTQMNLLGFVGNGALQKVLQSEEGRSQLLVDAINQYYLVLQHRFSVLGILNQYGSKFGFHCQRKEVGTSEEARAYFLDRISRGLPVMMSFSIGQKMVVPRFSLADLTHPGLRVDPRLWVPRQIGDRNNGGHTIVAEGIFMIKNRPQLLVVDSDWGAPRVWDLEDYFGPRTAFKEVEFFTCN